MNRQMKYVCAAMLAVALGASSSHAQTVATKRVMRQKLAESQDVLTALVTSNWTALDQHSRAIQKLTTDPAWAVLKSPEYMRQTEVFQGALAKVIASAGMRDQDTALAAYTGLVSGCVGCHKQIARSRIVTGR